jgi:hypothetical protein
MGVMMISDTLFVIIREKEEGKIDADHSPVTDKQVFDSSVRSRLEEEQKPSIICYRQADDVKYKYIDTARGSTPLLSRHQRWLRCHGYCNEM